MYGKITDWANEIEIEKEKVIARIEPEKGIDRIEKMRAKRGENEKEKATRMKNEEQNR